MRRSTCFLLFVTPTDSSSLLSGFIAASCFLPALMIGEEMSPNPPCACLRIGVKGMADNSAGGDVAGCPTSATAGALAGARAGACARAARSSLNATSRV